MTPREQWVPESCTLPAADRPLRVEEFDALLAGRVRHVDVLDATSLQLELRGDTALADTARDLARRETECCSFFSFTIAEPAPDRITLTIGVDDAHTGVLRALGDRVRRTGVGEASDGGDPGAGR